MVRDPPRDCVALLRDARCTAQKFPREDLAAIAAQPDSPLGAVARVVQHMMLVQDAPDHTRLRGLVNKAFTPRVVAGLAPRVQALVDGALDDAREAKRLDVIADLAVPLPIAVISDLLGVPEEQRPSVKRWSAALVTFLDGTIRDGGLADAAAACDEMRVAMGALFEARRSAPQDDLVSALVGAREAGDRLSDDELLATVVLILAAGHETTTNLIGNGLHALLRHPDQLALLRDRPELIRSAVEELLRFDPPVQLTARRATEDFDLRGRRVRAGDELNLFFAAANRDPAVFEAPDRLDVTRADNRHLSFGFGAHFCLGAALARLEGQIALQTVVQRLPGLALESPDTFYRPGIVLRGLTRLDVRF